MIYTLSSSSVAYLLNVIVISFFALVFLRIKFKSKCNLPLPPGPKGRLISGSAFDLPKTGRAQKFKEWGKTHGPIIHISTFGRSIIVLNSYAAAVDLLEKRSAIYSNRPYFPMATLAGWDRSVSLGQYSPRHRSMRKKLHNVLGGKNIEEFTSIGECEVKRYLKKILKDPDKFVEISRWLIGDIILRITYGYNVAEKDDPLVKVIELVASQFSTMTKPGAFIVDLLPSLRHLPSWFPGAAFKRTAAEYKSTYEAALKLPYGYAKNLKGSSSKNFVAITLGDQAVHDEDEEELIMFSSGGLYAGGSDTSVSAVTTFFLMMANHPSIQQKAQREIDSVLGGIGTRLPNFRDKPFLPYINALIKEVLRWGVVLPTGIPHCVTKEDEYNGYRIPKGATVISNIWAICRDPSIYPDPECFNPERFLGPGEKVQLDPTEAVFGFGRRICPGMQLAEQMLFITIASTLAAFDISPREGVTLTQDYTNETISHPKPFELNIRPRSPQMETLILLHENIISFSKIHGL